MTRVFAGAAIAVLLVVFGSDPARAQASEDSSSELQCFPWQEMKGGRCVAKPASAPPAAPAAAPALAPAPTPAPARAPEVSTDPCGTRGLSTPCQCPAASHLDMASGTCVADAPATPPAAVTPVAPTVAIVCNGGTVANGACICPSGFELMSTDGNPGNGGTCVKAHAENCLGGVLTVSGTCLCTGQVVMSGETYGLEYVNGKCVPKRCPEQTVAKGGKCLAISTTAAVPEVQEPKPPAPKAADDADEHRRHCGKGMVRTHAGCAPARHRYPPEIGAIPSELQRYYRNYQITPGN